MNPTSIYELSEAGHISLTGIGIATLPNYLQIGTYKIRQGSNTPLCVGGDKRGLFTANIDLKETSTNWVYCNRVLGIDIS